MGLQRRRSPFGPIKALMADLDALGQRVRLQFALAEPHGRILGAGLEFGRPVRVGRVGIERGRPHGGRLRRLL